MNMIVKKLENVKNRVIEFGIVQKIYNGQSSIQVNQPNSAVSVKLRVPKNEPDAWSRLIYYTLGGSKSV